MVKSRLRKKNRKIWECVEKRRKQIGEMLKITNTPPERLTIPTRSGKILAKKKKWAKQLKSCGAKLKGLSNGSQLQDHETMNVCVLRPQAFFLSHGRRKMTLSIRQE